MRVSISWDALSRVRTDLNRHGKGYNEDAVVPRLLVQWGCERLTEFLQASGEIPAAGFVLEAEDWPEGSQATELLGRCGLI